MYLVDTENKLLVGRRYDSDHIHIDINPEATSYHHNKLKVGFHTRGYPLSLVIEVVVYGINMQNLRSRSLEWLCFDEIILWVAEHLIHEANRLAFYRIIIIGNSQGGTHG